MEEKKTEEVTEVTVVEKGGLIMKAKDFVKNHKKGVIVAGVGAGLLIGAKLFKRFRPYEDFDEDIFDDDENDDSFDDTTDPESDE